MGGTGGATWKAGIGGWTSCVAMTTLTPLIIEKMEFDDVVEF